jgi:hypothetical protein
LIMATADVDDELRLPKIDPEFVFRVDQFFE